MRNQKKIDHETELMRNLSELRTKLSKQESDLVKIILTLDDQCHVDLKQGLHYDYTIASAMRNIFSEAKETLRIAIPYVTKGGLRDFNEMLGSALENDTIIQILFRYPEENDMEMHEIIRRKYSSEIAVGKIWIGYLGEKNKGGLHAKVLIKDDDIAMISSANWTGYSLTINAEVGILTKSKRAILMLITWYDHVKRYAKLWNEII